MNKDNLTFLKFRERVEENPTVIVPLGAYEQHGPAGYLGTDYVIAEYLAKRVSIITGIIALPCLPYGFSSIHSNFSGTITLSKEVYKQVICSIVESLKNSGVKKIIFVNGHGGNRMALNEVLTIEDIYFIEWFTLTENVFFTNEHKSHAGSEELSLLSYINQQYVSRELVQNMIPSKLNVNWREIDPIERKTEYLTENGVFYNADKYDINIGREIAEYVIDHMIEEVKKIVSG